jgi:predicted ATP-dependent endonuclease of OLD family
MKINAFHIRNYRSIVDSRKCFLSPDYITALIGQNESGKTSVLEALRSFYEGTITDDVLRSDLTFPEITCTFMLDEGKVLADYIDMATIPDELRPSFASIKEVSVMRKWHGTQNSAISIAEQQIVDFYNQLNNNRLDSVTKIIALIPELTRQAEVVSKEIQASENGVSIARSEFNNAYNHVEDLEKSLAKRNSPDVQITASQELEKAKLVLVASEETLKEKLTWIEAKKTDLQHIAEKLSVAKQFNDFMLREHSLNDELQIKAAQIKEAEYRLKTVKSDRESRKISKSLDQLREMNRLLIDELQVLNEKLIKSRKTAQKVLAGSRRSGAEQEALLEYEQEKGYASPEDIGTAIFRHMPMFEFFEDFSSLLPNKIDLDDLLDENTQVEGYKAARNFLCVAGLNADFFREENHRILKQKIENLNSEITIDFQDYWRQSVGKNDKIRINFELEHYDNSQPEKSGKPYLEFWVKDKQERLYPKQRSRGVRWFLSFYLELKATAKEKKTDRVMLIDEPGLSLHARAQEDVLKVFEDLRENLQIIYCTHSPNLIDLKKLYRIIAVQRAKDSDEKSETIVMDARSLNEASSDTLSPIYALMGTRLNDRQFIFPKNNLIVEDTVTFHYLDAMSRLHGFKEPVHFIPASGSELVPMLANIMLGWKIDFGVLLMDNQVNAQLIEFLDNTTFYAERAGNAKGFKILEGIPSVEDLFSTIDFKRFILKQRAGITIKNSDYIETNKLSRMILVSDFHTKLESENIQYKDFDEETRANFEKVFSIIHHMIEKN